MYAGYKKPFGKINRLYARITFVDRITDRMYVSEDKAAAGRILLSFLESVNAKAEQVQETGGAGISGESNWYPCKAENPVGSTCDRSVYDLIVHSNGNAPDDIIRQKRSGVSNASSVFKDSVQRNGIGSNDHVPFKKIYLSIYGTTPGIIYNTDNSERTGKVWNL